MLIKESIKDSPIFPVTLESKSPVINLFISLVTLLLRVEDYTVDHASKLGVGIYSYPMLI